MKAVVLVGGEGTRLRPLTSTTPKQMLPIVGVPMIERVLGHLGAHGIDEAVLSLGYLPDAFMSAYPDAKAAGVVLAYAVEPEPLDTAGAIAFAARHVGVDETFVVLNGDVLTDFDITGLVAFHRSREAQGTIALHPVEDPSRFGVVPTDDEGRVIAFIEKPPIDEVPTNKINAGIYVLEPSVLDRIEPGRRVSIERETFPAMVADRALFALSDESYWLDTGTPAAYLQAHRDLLEGRRGDPPVEGARRLRERIWTSGAPVLDGTVTGASWVGAGARIEAGSSVSDSTIGDDCVIEPGTTISGSVLLAGVRVGSEATVEQSILGAGSTVGPRCQILGTSVLGANVEVPAGTVVDGERVPA